jgi:hypothetical protein
MIPMSTMVPMAMAMPPRLIRLESTLKIFIRMKAVITARGRLAEMRILERK